MDSFFSNNSFTFVCFTTSGFFLSIFCVRSKRDATVATLSTHFLSRVFFSILRIPISSPLYINTIFSSSKVIFHPKQGSAIISFHKAINSSLFSFPKSFSRLL
jgi:hypothetical protein